MSNKTFTLNSKRMDQDEIIDLLKSIYEHSPWVPIRLFSTKINTIIDKEYLYKKMKAIVDNASKKEKLKLIRSHPELGNKLQKIDELTKYSKEEQKSAGLNQCTAEEFKVLTDLNQQYRTQFEFPFIIAVKGLYKSEIISEMKKRVNSTKQEEFETAMNEIHKIAKLRIYDLNY